MNAVTTSIRMPKAVHEQYETLARATGRTRNELMVEALSQAAERRLYEIAMIQEGLVQVHAGRTIAVEEVIAEFKRDGLLPTDFALDDDDEGTPVMA